MLKSVGREDNAPYGIPATPTASEMLQVRPWSITNSATLTTAHPTERR